MDPFAALPWFILRDILCLLPDLPTLHRASQSSRAVSGFLRRTGAFPHVVETIIAHKDRAQGVNPKVQLYLRTLVYVWWRGSPDAAADDNPLPASFEDVAYFIGKSCPDGKTLPTGFGDSPIPRSTPSAVLYRLLELSTQLRQTAHACFHDWMARCRALKPERRENQRAEFSHLYCHPRPRGVPITPVDIGPPSWLEEQRLIRAILRYHLFWELKAAVTTGILSADRDNMDLALFAENDIQTFWCGATSTPIPRLRADHGTQFKAVFAWLQQQRPIGPESLYCCPELTPLSAKQLQLPDDSQMSFVPGYVWMRKINKGRSPMRNLDRTIFQQLGFDFWDEERLVALGFMVPLNGKSTSPGSHRDEQDLWYRWSSILTESQWIESIQRQL
ncbi:uncharacterized protein N7459_002532 [Penicillium hispanicum]|uniref:uncharacterized protein n=1 Tax=Penicillium hispanicum TaxID=1080232 RepID=UPI00253FDFDC|nr:uncharacterized protein N7459_002532 [Penicillium hispanicum]KAJ5586767.1 hypothetical protein N7459_002532 [Penicillium hispanicum]